MSSNPTVVGLRMLAGFMIFMAVRMISQDDAGGFVALLMAVVVAVIAERAGRARE